MQKHSKLNLILKQVKQIFQAGDDRSTKVTTIATDQEKILKKVFLLANTVPRNSMLSRWCETGNFQPSLLSNDTSGIWCSFVMQRS